MKLYTIGHSNHPIDKFIGLLQDNNIAILADIRSRPYSRFSPQYNKDRLKATLAENRIGYVYLGDTLGGRPADPSCYLHQEIPKVSKEFPGEINYPIVMTRPWFIEGIHNLLELINQHTTSILCSEAEPTRCHRHHLVATYLIRQFPDATILHIQGNGTVINANSIPAIDPSHTDQLT